MFSGLFIYFINLRVSRFPRLLFQTRYGRNCFAKQTGKGGIENAFITDRNLPGQFSARYPSRKFGRLEPTNVSNAKMSL